MRRHNDYYEDVDPFDPVDDVDGVEGFIITDDLDELEEVWYSCGVQEHVLCDFDIGDEDGLCVKDRFGCHIEGCPYADSNE